MKSKNNFLGIDVGSVAISIALLDLNKNVLQTVYDFHEGRIAEKLKKLLVNFNLDNVSGVASTSSSPKIIKSSVVCDSRIAYITAAKFYFPNAGSILLVGGEKFGLVQFDKKQNYRNFRSNSSCAAGTGSFLDQQSKRLNLKDISEFSKLASHNKGDFPKIASRCSVFAKTDLIHAQQEGYSLPEICDGLCYGLAKNIVDTLFYSDKINQPMVFAGGVSLNGAVKKHIEKLTGIKALVGTHSNLYGAIGAAMNAIDEKIQTDISTIVTLESIVKEDIKEKKFFYKPLTLRLSDYPDFKSTEKYNFDSQIFENTGAVEIDIYTALKRTEYEVFLGIDIGSTSTKAILLDSSKNVLAGFYTRTAGQPVTAVRCIFESIQNIVVEKNINLIIRGAGTTGSGRKFIGRIIGADIIPDEISAHARAATELDKEVDTIIEIGGQDAKFTTLKNGNVTFSVMNNVCAAGTGSFIEEQAKKLGVDLFEYSKRAVNSAAPMASDRCTVFMERDLNHYINENYKTNEILASVLHSVRENYLAKVAVEKNIGEKIFFQGATAKNQALVAAFEQKLNKPIMVSEYCHLTGAYGVALDLLDQNRKQSKFRGIQLYKTDIPVRTETCTFCTNHCKYKIAEVDGETEAYGFLCGRDYSSSQYVENNTSDFNLIKEYNSQFAFEALNNKKATCTIGIPTGLYLFDDLYLWQHFFDALHIRTINTSKFKGAVKIGKRISGAEFCAPMSAIQGQVKYLLDKADYIFLPTYLEDQKSTKKKRRQYCYYSQFAPPVIASIEAIEERNKIVNPLLYSLQNETAFKKELYTSLKSAGINGFTQDDVSQAYDRAKKAKQLKKEQWYKKFLESRRKDKNLKVVLLGRPYTVLSQTMNNNIPELFAQKGVKTFYQDMLNVDENEVESLNAILKDTKWKFGAAILSAAEKIARSKDLYPVFISSFKCSPDSFIIEYFKEILDAYDKPYLVLQLDEYDSNVGYETRIEAALRSFQNHFALKPDVQPIKKEFGLVNTITNSNELKGKILLMPSLGEYASKLLEANLRRNGIEAHTLLDTEDSIKKSLVANNGQCLPLNIILQNAIEYIEKHQLDPAKTVLWMMESPVSCNLGMFINYLSKQLKEKNSDLRKIRMYTGKITFSDISISTSINAYLAFLFGGYLRKIECRIRPYEIKKGETDAVIKKSLKHFYSAFEQGTSKEEALKQVITWVKQIAVSSENRPKVAIFGDLYARDNDVFNQNLVRFIEENGGEAITTPYSDYIKIIFLVYNKRIRNEGFLIRAGIRHFLIALATQIEKKYLQLFNEILKEPEVALLRNYEDNLDLAHLKTAYNGESIDNVLKIIHLKEQFPEIALFVQTNPSYCCPSLVTEAMASKLERISGVPIVTLEYDGTSASKNEDIIPFLKYAKV